MIIAHWPKMRKIVTLDFFQKVKIIGRTLNTISISKSAEFLLSSSVPDVESHCSSVGVEDKWMDFNSQSGNIFLLKLTSQVTFDKSSLNVWLDLWTWQWLIFVSHKWLIKNIPFQHHHRLPRRAWMWAFPLAPSFRSFYVLNIKNVTKNKTNKNKYW